MSNGHMAEALDLAARGLSQTSPNPAVGAVIVSQGEVVGRGYHIYADRKHAEIVALEQAGETARGARKVTWPLFPVGVEKARPDHSSSWSDERGRARHRGPEEWSAGSATSA